MAAAVIWARTCRSDFRVVIAGVILWFVFKYTRWGFELKIIGANPTAARYLGINIARNVVVTLVGFWRYQRSGWSL